MREGRERSQIPINVFELGLKNGLIREPEYVIAYAEFLLGVRLFSLIMASCVSYLRRCTNVWRCTSGAEPFPPAHLYRGRQNLVLETMTYAAPIK